jgi:phosphohistidine phosphatase
MLELLLLRHAKSAWDEPGVGDHERDLAPRGLRAAPRVGRLMREEGLVPDLALCSTATRARRTWELVAAELGREVPVQHLRGLYLAPPARMLDAVRRQDAGTARRIVLVGHDPGMHALAARLAGVGDPALVQLVREKFPTGALARFGLPEGQGGWRAAGEPCELLGFWRPRDLGAAEGDD